MTTPRPGHHMVGVAGARWVLMHLFYLLLAKRQERERESLLNVAVGGGPVDVDGGGGGMCEFEL